ncbi:MAG: 30S ribosomal protein S2 [Patescibacteria group bacterium]|nr:30S ribosomal protein S2 [Patescibacteria group bacterium]
METTIKEMLEAGVHFGHQKSRWNPKMSSFIFTERGGVHIFDLVKTEEQLKAALDFIAEKAKNGGTILFVGTKKQAQTLVREAAESCNMPYVSERWLGGMLTNFETFYARLKTLKTLNTRIEKENFATKKQLVVAKKKAEKMVENLGGISTLQKIPDVLFVIDIVREHNAIKEAKKSGIPVVAVVDSNANPDDIDYIIPGNDDAVKAIALYVNEVAKTINKYKPAVVKEDEEAK